VEAVQIVLIFHMTRRNLCRLIPRMEPEADADRVSDEVLLRRFSRDRDPAAIELLVRRHSSTVWTACRRVVANGSDAEDAFQATFLVLIQKAATVRGSSVGGFLHRVAVNASLKLRVRSARTPTATTSQLQELPAHSAEDDEWCSLVHEELALLPERYRLPLVLCDLESHSHAEAAKVLGWPIGSVSGRLSRARTLLRKRLVRRGFTGSPFCYL
jgi:RNA polymerase sigma factor (sigma-70 family)